MVDTVTSLHKWGDTILLVVQNFKIALKKLFEP